MESVELYRQLLGLSEPWTVERVDLDVAKGRVEVYVGHAPAQRFACPECGQELAVYDHLGEGIVLPAWNGFTAFSPLVRRDAVDR
jgi:transposase